MSRTDIGKDAYGGLNDAPQGIHLPRLRDASLEDGQLVVGIHLPYREGHADLGIIAFGIGHDAAVGREELDEPVLDDSLAVAARDSHHRDVEAATVAGGQQLQGGDHVRHLPYIGIGIVKITAVGDHKLAHAGTIKGVHITASAVALGGYGEEQGATDIGKTAAVGEQVLHLGIRCGHTRRRRMDGFFYF